MSEPDQNLSSPNYYIAIGASAGGLEAMQSFFKYMPADSGAAFIVIQHLSPDFKSVMRELLGRCTDMEIFNAVDENEMRANCVYLIPPRKNMMIAEGKLLLVDQMPANDINFPIDIFFRSLAEDQQHKTIAVILSGTGSDGSRGIQAIKEVGGLVLVQEPENAKFDGMPYNAIKTGVADVICDAREIPAKIVKYITHPLVNGEENSLLKQVESNDSALTEIFGLLQSESNIDFMQYKASTVIRRIERRISINGLHTLTEYHTLLLKNPRELQTLAKDLLIGVTRFFRDTDAFFTLESEVIPNILDRTTPSDPIRVWIAGCSTGEEAYSIAILFDEAMRKRGEVRSVKVFATDVDPDAIAEASTGHFSLNVRDDMSEERIQNYFVVNEEHVAVTPNIRKMVVFATHNLMRDPPFSNTQLTLCRNVLIYFQPQAQQKIISMLQFSLQKDGYLFLGSSETLGNLQSYFETVNERYRIFKKVSPVRLPNNHIGLLEDTMGKNKNTPSIDTLMRSYQLNRKTHKESSIIESLIEDYLPPCIVLDEGMDVLHAYGDISPFIQKLKPGRFSANIKDYIAEELSIAVTTAIHRAVAEATNVQYDNVEFTTDKGEHLSLVLRVRYIRSTSPPGHFIAVLFANSTPVNHDTGDGKVIVYDAQDQTKQRIRDLEYQLQKKQEHLQVTIEELETTNEELQSSNEELLAANEELQSTNEELQSVNEELYTVNSEYQEKIDDLQQANTDINNIINSIDIGIIFLDTAMLIRKYSPAATKEVNLMPSDIGRPFHHISHNLEYDTMLNDIAKVIDSRNVIEKEISTDHESRFLVTIAPYLDEKNVPEGCVITLTNITEKRLLEAKLKESFSELQATIASAFKSQARPTQVLILDDDSDDIHIVRQALNSKNSFNTKFSICEASDCDRANEIIQGKTLDVCIIDYNLGEMNAFDFIDMHSANTDAPAFVILSGVITEELYDEAAKRGVYDIINKSEVSPQLLERSIRYTLRHKQTEAYLNKQKHFEIASPKPKVLPKTTNTELEEN